MPLFQTIEGVDVSGRSSVDAKAVLQDRYDTLKVGLYFGKNKKPYREPLLRDIGVNVLHEQQIASAQYSWWLRLVPSSLWWAHLVTRPSEPTYRSDSKKVIEYVSKELGNSCSVTAVNATLEYKDKKLNVIPAVDGGTCELKDVEKQLGLVKPTLSRSKVRIAMVEHPAKIHDSEAKAYAERLTSQAEKGVNIDVEGQKVPIPTDNLLSWLDFKNPDTGIVASVNQERAKTFFEKEIAPKIAISPGTSKVTTLDFEKIAEIPGATGRALDMNATAESVNAWLVNPGNFITAKTMSVAPTVAYTRTYTSTDKGFSALIEQFVQSKPGVYGVSFAELDSRKRHATYQADKIFRTASTYKLFVAYGALKRVETGAWHMTDQIHGGRSLAKCLDDMIVKSDNPCGEVLLEKIGYKTLTNELKAIGLAKSSFTNSYPETTAGDLTVFVGALKAGQLLNQSSTNILLGAMTRNIYRQGIPAGANGQTADKVGFLDNLLHDAAIVYSPSGTYALSIMTEGSSWGVIAELTREIEKLRTQN